MKIILLRHGETEWNALYRYQGHTDISLNDNGKAQARRAARYLRENEQVEAVYCSDLSRTRQTAEIAAQVLEQKVYYDGRLRELCFGVWEGLTFSEVYERYRDDWDKWYKDGWNFKMPGGETFTEVVARAGQALNEIASRHTGTVLVVTHGGVIKALLGHFDPSFDLWQTDIAPGSMTYIESENGNYKILKTGLRNQSIF